MLDIPCAVFMGRWLVRFLNKLRGQVVVVVLACTYRGKYVTDSRNNLPALKGSLTYIINLR